MEGEHYGNKQARTVTNYPSHHTADDIEEQATRDWMSVPVAQLDCFLTGRAMVFLWSLLTRSGLIFFDILDWAESRHQHRDGLGAWTCHPSNKDILVEVNYIY